MGQWQQICRCEGEFSHKPSHTLHPCRSCWRSPASHETGLTCRLRNSDNNIVLFYFILLSYSCSVYHYQLKVPFQGLYSYFFSTIVIILKLQLDLTYNRFPKLKSCRLASWSSPSSRHIPRLLIYLRYLPLIYFFPHLPLCLPNDRWHSVTVPYRFILYFFTTRFKIPYDNLYIPFFHIFFSYTI